MPTATFLSLPPEKQERLMDAASREFASKPYNEASINRIIQEAGVPRGSFYMYFQDKEDLFRYLVQGYLDQMTMVLEEALVRQGGDVFAALLYLYDYITQKREAYDLGGMGAMAVIVGQNSGMQKSALLEMVDSEAVMARLREKLNPDLLGVLLTVAVPLIYAGLQSGGDPEHREHLANILAILQRGMAAKSKREENE